MEKCGLRIHVEKINVNHYLTPYTRILNKSDLHVYTLKLFFFKSEESIGESLQSCGVKKIK